MRIIRDMLKPLPKEDIIQAARGFLKGGPSALKMLLEERRKDCEREERKYERLKKYNAARLKSKYALSYADCFAAALAKEKDCPVLTGDPEFKKLHEEIKISWL